MKHRSTARKNWRKKNELSTAEENDENNTKKKKNYKNVLL